MVKFFKNNLFFHVTISFVVILAGCATAHKQDVKAEQPEQSKKLPPCKAAAAQAYQAKNVYSLYVNSSGNLVDTKNNRISDTGKYLDAIFENYNKLVRLDNRIELVLFIHGGLNESQDVDERVKSLWKPMLEDCRYPLFVSWRSGMLGNYSDHLLFLRQGVYSSSTSLIPQNFDDLTALIKGPIASTFVLVEDILRGISRIPASTYKVLVDNNYDIAQRLLHGADRYRRFHDTNTYRYDRVNDINYHSRASDEGLTALDVWSIGNPLKLAAAPFGDSFGTGAWSSMLRRTDFVLAKDEQFNGHGDNPTAVTQFVDRWSKNYPTQKIILIGHSMGTIIANKLIAKFHEVEFSPIVYMAAACSLSDIEQIVSPYLWHKYTREFYNLSLSPTRDEMENMSGFDFVSRGSLLVWIDNVFGSINSFDDRTAGYWPNITKVAARLFPKEIRKQVHLTKFGVADESSPQNHGDFDNFPFWDKKFWKAEYVKN